MDFLKYGVGIDIAKEKFDACISIIDKLQHVIIRAQCSFNNNKKGFEAFFLWATKNAKLAIPAVEMRFLECRAADQVLKRALQRSLPPSQ